MKTHVLIQEDEIETGAKRFVFLNRDLWQEELRLQTELHLLEKIPKDTLLERIGAFLLSYSYQSRLEQIQALKKKGIQ